MSVSSQPPSTTSSSAGRVDPRDPGEGRVAVRFESVRSRQSIGINVERPGLAMNYEDVCDTPCTLYLPPGPGMVIAEGIGIERSETEFAIPTFPSRVRLHAPAASAVTFGRTATIIGVGSALVGVVLLAIGATDAAQGPIGPGTTAFLVAGGITAGVGAGLIIPGLIVLSRVQTGIESAQPMAPTSSRSRMPSLGFTIVF
jgi:hypothetical protein